MLPILKEPKGRPRTFGGAGAALEEILMKHIRIQPPCRGRVFVYKMDRFLPAHPCGLMQWKGLIREPASQHFNTMIHRLSVEHCTTHQ